MTDPETDPKLRRIRALLANADDPAATTGEAEAFREKALELIAKYGIDAAMLSDPGDVVTDRVLVLNDPYSRQKANLLHKVCGPMRVSVVFNVGASRSIRGFRVHMFGHGSDLQRVDVLFNSLQAQMSLKLAQIRPPGQSTRGQLAAFRRDWMEGFGDKVGARLMEATRRAGRETEERTGVGTGLVLRHRSGAVEQAVDHAYPKLTNSDARRIRSKDAYRQGMHDGAQADLGGNRIGPK